MIINPALRALISMVIFACSAGAASTYIDMSGVLRWTDSKEKVCVFGTNYTIPFSYWDWRAPIGADYRKAIDEDVYHMARLGLDGYRVHVWDSYISDEKGNLVGNEHLELFDYLLFRLKERGIKMFITPMYLGGNGGFASRYGGKAGCLSNPGAFPVMANYLAQFVSHVNPHTGLAYKDDPDILGFEIVNEPHHFKHPELVTGYINQMVDSIRAAGCDKPLFYNMTTCSEQIGEVLLSKVDGGTFQWYPTGLTANHNQRGNMLPNVDRYHIPFADKLSGKRPKFIYEFSPSDVGDAAVMYPAMARSFREAGFQFAAHFAYDPLHAAYCNLEYRTHYLNLAYTPKKAIGLMIAAEAFRRIPLGQCYGRFPANNTFDAFSLDYEKNLAEMVTDTAFLYSNSTRTEVPEIETLEQVAGVGCSTVVRYEGNGAYFLDRLEDGIWRLEVMPDTVWVKDPFFVPDWRRECAIVKWSRHPMAVNLPDLGDTFAVAGLNDGNEFSAAAEGGRFLVAPGTYLLSRGGRKNAWTGASKWNYGMLGEYHAPKREMEQDYLLHEAPDEASAGAALKLNATVVGRQDAAQVDLILLGVGGGKTVPMQKSGVFEYEAMVPPEFVEKPGMLRYHIGVCYGEQWRFWPGGDSGSHLLKRRIYADDRLVDDTPPYSIPIVEAAAPVVLFDASSDWRALTKMNRKDRIDCCPASVPGKQMLFLQADKLETGEHDYSVRSYCADRLTARADDLSEKETLAVYGHALNAKSCRLQVSLITKGGAAFGAIVKLLPEAGWYEVPMSDLKQVKYALLPRPYPVFHAYWQEQREEMTLPLDDVESVQFSIGPGIPENEWAEKQGVAVGWVVLKQGKL